MITPVEVLVMVKPWVAEQKGLDSASFRATKIRSDMTGKAVLLILKDGRRVWVPWAAVLSMEETKP